MTLLLSGVVLNAFFSAGIMFVNLIAAPRDQDRILRWLIGGLQDRYEPSTLAGERRVASPRSRALALAWSRELNLLSLSETDADRAGVRVTRLRTAFFGLGSLLTAIAVTISGPIAFVGLIVPHIVRLLVGPDHRLLVPLCVARRRRVPRRRRHARPDDLVARRFRPASSRRSSEDRSSSSCSEARSRSRGPRWLTG